MQYGPGDYFGELALIFDKPRKATVKSKKTGKVLTLERDAFTKLLGPMIDVMTRESDQKYAPKK